MIVCLLACLPNALAAHLWTLQLTYLLSLCFLATSPLPESCSSRESVLRADGYPTAGQMHTASSMLLGGQAGLTAPHHYHHFASNSASSVASAFASGPFGAANSFALAHHQPPTDPHHELLFRTSVSHW